MSSPCAHTHANARACTDTHAHAHARTRARAHTHSCYHHIHCKSGKLLQLCPVWWHNASHSTSPDGVKNAAAIWWQTMASMRTSHQCSLLSDVLHWLLVLQWTQLHSSHSTVSQSCILGGAHVPLTWACCWLGALLLYIPSSWIQAYSHGRSATSLNDQTPFPPWSISIWISIDG